MEHTIVSEFSEVEHTCPSEFSELEHTTPSDIFDMEHTIVSEFYHMEQHIPYSKIENQHHNIISDGLHQFLAHLRGEVSPLVSPLYRPA